MRFVNTCGNNLSLLYTILYIMWYLYKDIDNLCRYDFKGLNMNSNKLGLKKVNEGFSLGERLVYLRERRHITQQELAKAADLSQSTIAHIEGNRKDPSISTLKKLATALDIHIAVLFSTDTVYVFDMDRLKKKYDHVDKLNPTLYHALGKVVAYAKEISFLK